MFLCKRNKENLDNCVGMFLRSLTIDWWNCYSKHSAHSQDESVSLCSQTFVTLTNTDGKDWGQTVLQNRFWNEDAAAFFFYELSLLCVFYR